MPKTEGFLHGPMGYLLREGESAHARARAHEKDSSMITE